MDDVFFVDILNRVGNLQDILGSLQLIKFFSRTLHKSLKELSLFSKLEDKVDREVILEMIVKFDNVMMLELIHNLHFRPDVVDQTLSI